MRDQGITAEFVTRDEEEAMGVSGRIAVTNNGQIEQFADPFKLYARSVSPFVMLFVGLSTRFSGVVSGSAVGVARIDTGYGTFRAQSDLVVRTHP